MHDQNKNIKAIFPKGAKVIIDKNTIKTYEPSMNTYYFNEYGLPCEKPVKKQKVVNLL
jgi:hypothetical protein